MKLLFLITGMCVALASVQARADQKNFESVLKRIQHSYWEGHFRATALGGVVDCRGPLDVTFFPMQVEKFSGGIPTVSYRHHTDLSHTDLICRDVVGMLSPVAVGECEEKIPRKYNPREGRRVPFRTIIPRDGGASAVVSSPSCDPFGNVTRQELKLGRIRLGDHDNTLQLNIEFEIPPFGEVSELTYILHRK